MKQRDDRKTPPKERGENVVTPIKEQIVLQTSVRQDTEDPRLGRAACGKMKTSHNDGGERGTHTSATDPRESGMKGESVHMSSKQDHQGIRTTQHIVSKPDRSNNAIDIFVRSK